MTITAQDVPDADAHSIIAVWEFKHVALAGKDHSQLYGHLQLLGWTQPYSHNFFGILSNFLQNIVNHTRSPLGDDLSACKVYNSASVAYVISYIRECIIPDSSYHPASLGFPMYFGIMYRRLGYPLLDPQNPDFQEGKWINATPNTVK